MGPRALEVLKMGERARLSWWSWHSHPGRAAPSTPQSGCISLHSQGKSAVLGEGQRYL